RWDFRLPEFAGARHWAVAHKGPTTQAPRNAARVAIAPSFQISDAALALRLARPIPDGAITMKSRHGLGTTVFIALAMLSCAKDDAPTAWHLSEGPSSVISDAAHEGGT